MNLATDENRSVLNSTVAAPTASPEITESSHPAVHSLPDEPLVIIEPRRLHLARDLRDLWAYRELLYFLTWRDLKVRYKQTVLGVAWVVMQPLLMTLIFTLFLGKLAHVPSGDAPYPVFAYTGLLAWTFFSSAVATSGNSLVGSSHLITKVYFPRMIIPAAAVAARLVDFVIAFVILAVLMIYYQVTLTRNLLLLPAMVLLLMLLALGTGMWTSALNVKYRDVGVILPVLTQLWMFVSPVIYPAGIVPDKWRWLYALNPLTGAIENFRAALLGRSFDWAALGISVLLTLILLGFAVHVFRRMERSFADVI